MRIAVYSGSFDPLHKGHEAIMRHLTGSGAFDRIYLVVSPQSPFKDADKADSARERYAAARSALRRHRDIKVRLDDIEMGMPAPHYTIRTLDALSRREPENSFTLVIGADNLAVFRNWKDWRRILREYGVVVFPREGHDSRELRASLLAEDPTFRISLAEMPLVNISSSTLREARERGEDVSEFLM